MIRKLLKIHIVLVIFLFCCPVIGWGAQHWVDCDTGCGGNDGSESNPYCSLSEWHSATSPSCGDTALLKTSTCTTQFIPTRDCNGTGYIVIKAAPGATPEIRFTTTNNNTNNAAMYFFQIGGYQIGDVGAGLLFQGQGVNASRHAIYQNLGGATTSNKKGLRVIGNTFNQWGKHNRVAAESRATVRYGTAIGPTFTKSIEAPVVAHNRFLNSVGHAVKMSSTLNGIIEFNDILDPLCALERPPGNPNITKVLQEVIKVGRSNATAGAVSQFNIVRHNHIEPPAESRAQCHAANDAHPDYDVNSGFDEWYPLWCDVSSQDVRYFRNFIEGRADWPSAGLFVESRCVGARVAYNVAKNFQFSVRNTNQYDGHNGQPGWPNYFWQNVLYSTVAQPRGVWHRRHEMYFRNNLVYLTASDARAYDADSDGGSLDPPSLWSLADRNLYYTPNDNTPFVYPGNSNRTLEQWRTLSGSDANSLDSNPHLVNVGANDFNSCVGNGNPPGCTAASPLHNAGRPITGVVVNQQQQTGTIFNEFTSSNPDIGIERILVGTGQTLSTSSITLPFFNTHGDFKQCTAASLSITGSTSGTRTALSATPAGTSVTLTTSTPLLTGETITVTGAYDACRSIFAGVGTSNANTIWAKSAAFTNTPVTNTLSGPQPPTVASCAVEDATDTQVQIVLNPNAGTLSPSSGATGITCREGGVAQTVSGTGSLVGSTYTFTFTNAFESGVGIDCSYNQGTGNITTANGELVAFTNFACANRVDNPLVAPVGNSLIVGNTVPDTVVLEVTTNSTPMLPANDCTGIAISGKTVTDCDRQDDTHFAIKVTPPFVCADTATGTYTQQGSGVAERIRDNAGTEMLAFSLPVTNGVQCAGAVYTVPHWRITMPGTAIGSFWLFPEETVPSWFTVPVSSVLPSFIVRMAIFAASAVETGWVWFGREGAGSWFRLTHDCGTNPLCLANDGIRSTTDQGSEASFLTLDGRSFVPACSGYTTPLPSIALACALTGSGDQAEQEAGIRIGAGSNGTTYQVKLCPDSSSDCSEVTMTTPLTVTVGPGASARY